MGTAGAGDAPGRLRAAPLRGEAMLRSSAAMRPAP